MSKLELVQFKTTDKLFLPGLLYEPDKKTDKVLINLHGNGSSSVFYSVDDSNIIGKTMNKSGIAYFTFNNRGAHYVKTIRKEDEEDKVRLGMAYEVIKDCVKDIDGAIAFLSKQGYRKFYLIGYSTGANKICVYNYYRPRNRVSKFILSAPGDDMGIYYDMWGKNKFKRALDRCKREIRKGNRDSLVPKYLVGDLIISYQSLYDTINPNGDYNVFPYLEYLENLNLSKKKLFREFKSLNKPTLVMLGEEDEYMFGRVSEIAQIFENETSVPQKFQVKTIKGADHGFHGHQQKAANLIADWLLE